MSSPRSLSVIIPVLNERENISILVGQILSIFDQLKDFTKKEVIIIDDGSNDGTTEIVEKLAQDLDEVTTIIFRKNFGKSAALMAGFEVAQGDVLVTIDGDLQDDPNEIPMLIEKIDEGYDLVSGWKSDRQDPLEKRWASKIFNGVISRASGVKIHDFNCGLKAYRGWCAKTLQIRGNQHRYIPAILSWYGARIAEVSVTHHRRRFGVSKYGLSRYFHGAFDFFTLILLTKFSQNPLYLFALVGTPIMLIGLSIASYLVGTHVLYLLGADWGEKLNNRPLLLISFSLMAMGIQIFLIGLISELVLRTSPQNKGFSIRSVVRRHELRAGE